MTESLHLASRATLWQKMRVAKPRPTTQAPPDRPRPVAVFRVTPEEALAKSVESGNASVGGDTTATPVIIRDVAAVEILNEWPELATVHGWTVLRMSQELEKAPLPHYMLQELLRARRYITCREAARRLLTAIKSWTLDHPPVVTNLTREQLFLRAIWQGAYRGKNMVYP